MDMADMSQAFTLKVPKPFPLGDDDGTLHSVTLSYVFQLILCGSPQKPGREN